MTDYHAFDRGLPCKNPSCASHGSPHPNCRCYDNTFADGGSVCAQLKPHQPGCEYYAEGGDVMPPPPVQAPDNVPNTLGMSAVHQGFLGLLKNTGRSKLSDPDQHTQKVHDIRNEEIHEKRIGHLHEHPLSGGASKKHLEPILQRLAGPMQTQEANPSAFRSAVDYLQSSLKGEASLKEEMKRFFTKRKDSDEIRVSPESRESLKKHLDSIQEHPEQMLELGGDLGHYLPEHSSGLAYQSAQAVQYFQSLKPKTQKLAPLDTEESVGKMEEAAYHRQLDIAEKPTLVIQHMEDSTLIPQDLTTVKTIYPGLYQSMVKEAMSELIEAQTKGIELPYSKKMGLSELMGQPLDFTQTPQAAMAVMASTMTPAPASQSAAKTKKTSGVTSPELKAIEKSDEMVETSLEARQIDKRTQ